MHVKRTRRLLCVDDELRARIVIVGPGWLDHNCLCARCIDQPRSTNNTAYKPRGTFAYTHTHTMCLVVSFWCWAKNNNSPIWNRGRVLTSAAHIIPEKYIKANSCCAKNQIFFVRCCCKSVTDVGAVNIKLWIYLHYMYSKYIQIEVNDLAAAEKSQDKENRLYVYWCFACRI